MGSVGGCGPGRREANFRSKKLKCDHTHNTLITAPLYLQGCKLIPVTLRYLRPFLEFL